ncbi:MAG: hypothetical protein JWP35_450 [Caulobacter sp.]|nr:hypothetical protein [Caulobacter sp.]
MQTVELIGVPGASYVRAVRMACEEKAIPYTLTSALPNSPQVMAIHPFAKMPVMRHGDVELCESKAIVTYLDAAFPGAPLLPTEPALAPLSEMWISLVNTTIDRTMVREYTLSYVFPKGEDGKPDRRVIDASLEPMRHQMGVLDKAVAADGYLVGGRLTFADMNLLPILASVRRYPEGEAALAAAPNLSAYFARLSQLPSYRAVEV